MSNVAQNNLALLTAQVKDSQEKKENNISKVESQITEKTIKACNIIRLLQQSQTQFTQQQVAQTQQAQIKNNPVYENLVSQHQKTNSNKHHRRQEQLQILTKEDGQGNGFINIAKKNQSLIRTKRNSFNDQENLVNIDLDDNESENEIPTLSMDFISLPSDECLTPSRYNNRKMQQSQQFIKANYVNTANQSNDQENDKQTRQLSRQQKQIQLQDVIIDADTKLENIQQPFNSPTGIKKDLEIIEAIYSDQVMNEEEICQQQSDLEIEFDDTEEFQEQQEQHFTERPLEIIIEENEEQDSFIRKQNKTTKAKSSTPLK